MPTPVGLNVVGHLEAELGVGEIARQLVAACDAAGVPVLPVSLPATASRQGHWFPHATPPATAFPTTLACLNADQLPRLSGGLGPRERTVGMWWWEVSVLPPWLAEAATHVDELWAGSTWLAGILRAAVQVPVHTLRIPVAIPGAAPPARPALGLPGGFLFLTLFDHNSVLDRKNPIGAIEAFRRAFPEAGSGPALVVKSINGHNHPESLRRVLAAAGGRPDIHVVDRYLDPDEKDSWLAACDCYVSLHRSEGYGLTIAEAMARERPVIATAWSGEADFTTPETAFVVPHRLVDVGPGNEPYPPDAQWADPDVDAAAQMMRRVVEDPAASGRIAAAARRTVAQDLSHAATGRRIAELLEPGAPTDRPVPQGARLVQELARLRAATPARPLPGRRAGASSIAAMPDPHDLVAVGRALAFAQAELTARDGELAAAERGLLEAEQRAALGEVVALERDQARAVQSDLEPRIALLRADADELRERLSRSQHLTEEMQASVSWRVTGPLRAIKRVLAERAR